MAQNSRNYFIQVDKGKWTRITLPAISKPLWAPLLSFWRSASDTVQMALVMVIVGTAILTLNRQAMHESTALIRELRQSTAQSALYAFPRPVEAFGSTKLVQPEPQVISGPNPVFPASGTVATVAFESATIFAGAAQSLIAIPVRRSRSTQGVGAVAWAIEDGTAQPNVDYDAIDSNVIRFFEGQEVRIYHPVNQKRDDGRFTWPPHLYRDAAQGSRRARTRPPRPCHCYYRTGADLKQFCD